MKGNLIEFCGRLRRPWNLIKTNNIDNISQVQIYRKDQYVWLLNKNVKLRKDFPLGWMPKLSKRFDIHTFYEYKNNKRTRPVLKLIPTNFSLIKKEIQNDIPVCYINNKYNIYFIGKNGEESVNQFKNQKKKIYDSSLVTGASDRTICQKILQTADTQYVWIIDVNLNINVDFDFNYQVNDDNIIYEFKPYGFAKLVPIEYIKTRGYGEFKTKQIEMSVDQ